MTFFMHRSAMSRDSLRLCKISAAIMAEKPAFNR
jgi:hypothetical protein